MRDRITIGMLERLATSINNALGMHVEPYTKIGPGKYRPNPGNYHLSGAYGGWTLHRLDTKEGTGATDVFPHGHVTARQLYGEMRDMLRGIYAAKEEDNG